MKYRKQGLKTEVVHFAWFRLIGVGTPLGWDTFGYFGYLECRSSFLAKNWYRPQLKPPTPHFIFHFVAFLIYYVWRSSIKYFYILQIFHDLASPLFWNDDATTYFVQSIPNCHGFGPRFLSFLFVLHSILPIFNCYFNSIKSHIHSVRSQASSIRLIHIISRKNVCKLLYLP